VAVLYFVWESRFAADQAPGAATPDFVGQPAADADGKVAPAQGDAPAPSIAVLPFADMSPEGDQAYFSDGISEELLNLLVRVEGLNVASRTSSFAFKGSNRGIAEIAEELQVDHVLEGSVRKADNRVRITAQLIDAKTDRHLWSDTFDRELTDIFAIQDEISNAIVGALQAELGILRNAPAITVTADTGNLDAYELYLRGRQLFIARDRMPESMQLLEQAVALDPQFARAWETLGAVYSVALSWGIDDRDYNRMAVEASRRALAINERLSMAWAVLGTKAMDMERDFIMAMDHLDRALDNDVKNTTALLWRSIVFSTLGFFDQAIEDARDCLELDPYYENCRRHLARHHLLNGDADLGLQLFQVSAERGFFGSNEVFAYELVRRGNRLAAALGIWQWQREDLTFPASVILDALEHPDRDHSDGLARFMDWIKRHGDDNANWSNELTILGGYEYARPNYFNNSWLWDQQSRGFRQSPFFKPLVVEIGLDRYWRERGFPPICRPLGADDFECDPDAYRTGGTP
jgi:TolB-like protein